MTLLRNIEHCSWVSREAADIPAATHYITGRKM